VTRAQAQPGTDPSQVPEIRDWIVRNLQPGQPMRSIMDLEALGRLQTGKTFGTMAHVELYGLSTAKLFWVPAAEQDIIVNAKATMPDDLCLSEDDIPYPSGFAVFENEFPGLDSETGETMDVGIKALRWSPLNIVDDDGTVIGEAMSMSSWTFETTRLGPMWLPMGRFDWRFGQNWKEYFTASETTPETYASLYEDRARFMAMWALMNTQDPLIYRPTRAEARRDARLAPMSPARLINVIKWDPHRYEGEYPHPTKSGRKVNVRFPVEGFWRRQAIGPRRTLRRWTYIPPHWRGPVDAPIKGQTITINKVVS
jgi:hypothetical protein